MSNLENPNDSTNPISHVFVLMLENHSFDNLFGCSGIPGIMAATATDTNTYNGTSYPFQCGAPVSMPTDPGHEFPDIVEQLAGSGARYSSGGTYPHPINNSGFAANYATTTSEGPVPSPGEIGEIMKGFDTPCQLPVIHELATEFAICDQWFSSLPGPTWPNRFFLHGASSNGLDHSPSWKEIAEWEYNPLGGFFFENGSIFDALTKQDLNYRLYNDKANAFSDHPGEGSIFGAIPIVAALKGIHHSEVHSFADFANDLQGSYDYQYTFIEPNYGDITSNYEGGSSQHPMDDTYGGERLLKATYEAIRTSPLWDSSLLIVTYDEHGGFYDSSPPPSAHAPNDGSPNGVREGLNEYGFTFEQLGPRVPAVVVSPRIPKGTVDHTVYDHSSVLATLRSVFPGLSPLTQRDENANSVVQLISLDSPRTDCPTTLKDPVKSAAPARSIRTAEDRATLDQEPIPESGNLAGFLGIALKTELELTGKSRAAKTGIIEESQKTLKTRGDARRYIRRVQTLLEAANGDAA